MWINYALAILTVLGIAAALFCWRLYKDAIRREIATSEVMCGVLLSPPLHIEFQNIAYERIGKRFPQGEDNPSDLEVALLQHELMTAFGDAAFLHVATLGAGVTLRRILSGPFVVGRNPDELWRYAGS
jgi:hypothetical protein